MKNRGFTYTHIQEAVFRLSKARFVFFCPRAAFFAAFLAARYKPGLYSTCPTGMAISITQSSRGISLYLVVAAFNRKSVLEIQSATMSTEPAAKRTK
jgi:hypothetical protein